MACETQTYTHLKVVITLIHAHMKGHLIKELKLKMDFGRTTKTRAKLEKGDIHIKGKKQNTRYGQ